MVFFLLKLGKSNSYLGFADGSFIDFSFNFNLMSFQKLLALDFKLIKYLIKIN
jgi:hypothetical protein